MKKYIISLLLLVSSHIASSQVLIALLLGDKLNSGKVNFGLVVGPGGSNMSNVDGKIKAVLDIGMYFNITLSDRWYLHPELLPKSNLGAQNIKPYSTGNQYLDTLYSGGNIARKISAISLPLLIRYRITKLLYVDAGPQIDLITQVKDIFKVKVNDNWLDYDDKVKDQYTRFDIGYAVGLAYKLKPGNSAMTIGVRYFGGLTDVMKNQPGTQLNKSLLLNIYIPIGVGSAPAKSPVKQSVDPAPSQ